MKHNKKVIIASILLLSIFGMFLIPAVKAPPTPVTTEEYIATKDTYVSSDSPDINTGNELVWLAGCDISDYTYHYTYLGFDISNIPENTTKVQIKIPVNIVNIKSEDIILGFNLTTNSWSEYGVTYNTRLNATHFIVNMVIVVGIISLYYLIDVTSFISEFGDEMTIIIEGNRYNSSLDEYPITGFTKELGDDLLVPSIIYTIENEIIIPPPPPLQNTDVSFLIIGVFIGMVLGVVGVIIPVLFKRNKSNF